MLQGEDGRRIIMEEISGEQLFVRTVQRVNENVSSDKKEIVFRVAASILDALYARSMAGPVAGGGGAGTPVTTACPHCGQALTLS
jgi:hypothetical protein